jgi:hypothetical protein
LTVNINAAPTEPLFLTITETMSLDPCKGSEFWKVTPFAGIDSIGFTPVLDERVKLSYLFCPRELAIILALALEGINDGA